MRSMLVPLLALKSGPAANPWGDGEGQTRGSLPSDLHAARLALGEGRLDQGASGDRFWSVLFALSALERGRR